MARLTFADAVRRADRVFVMIHAHGAGHTVRVAKSALRRSDVWAACARSVSHDGESAEDCEGKTLWSLRGDDLIIG